MSPRKLLFNSMQQKVVNSMDCPTLAVGLYRFSMLFLAGSLISGLLFQLVSLVGQLCLDKFAEFILFLLTGDTLNNGFGNV